MPHQTVVGALFLQSKGGADRTRPRVGTSCLSFCSIRRRASFASRPAITLGACYTIVPGQGAASECWIRRRDRPQMFTAGRR
jgi:hypothetical protein